MVSPEQKKVYSLISSHPIRYPLDNKCAFCNRTKNLERGHLDYEDDGFNYITVCHQCNIWMDKDNFDKDERTWGLLKHQLSKYMEFELFKLEDKIENLRNEIREMKMVKEQNRQLIKQTKYIIKVLNKTNLLKTGEMKLNRKQQTLRFNKQIKQIRKRVKLIEDELESTRNNSEEKNKR